MGKLIQGGMLLSDLREYESYRQGKSKDIGFHGLLQLWWCLKFMCLGDEPKMLKRRTGRKGGAVVIETENHKN